MHDAKALIDKTNSYFLKREMKTSGVIITISDSGQLDYRMGIQTKEDVADTKKADKNKQSAHNTNDPKTTDTISSNDYSQALRSDVELYKRSCLRCELVKYPDLSIELLHYSLIVDALSPILFRDQFNQVRASNTDNQTSREDYHDSKMNLIMEQSYKKLSLEWLDKETTTERVEGYISLTTAKKKAILAYVSAITLDLSLIHI